jgi:phosphoribosylpyrophosphate synthetase
MMMGIRDSMEMDHKFVGVGVDAVAMEQRRNVYVVNHRMPTKTPVYTKMNESQKIQHLDIVSPIFAAVKYVDALAHETTWTVAVIERRRGARERKIL